jgi:nicotinamide riboside transporter PnuC
MPSFLSITKAQEDSRHDVFNHACTWIQCQTRLIWTLSSLISLISARQLLVESNFHYPILLYLAQLFAATIVAISQYSWHRSSQDADDNVSWRECLRRGWLMTIGATCFTALSMACMLQAILHNQNLPTLIMLTVRLLTPRGKEFY